MFKRARIELTLLYLSMIMLVSISFSLFIHRAITAELERFERMQRVRIYRRIDPQLVPPPRVDPELIEETKQRVTLILFLINSGIFFISGGFGYILAGKTLRPIQQMVDEQSRFVSNASHELRTPLTSLKTGIEVALRDNRLDLGQAKQLLKENIEEVNKLEQLSGALLQLSRFEQNGFHAQFQKTSLNSVVNTAIKKVLALAKTKQITVNKNISKPMVIGDETTLIQLFVILFDNAIKYSPNKSAVTVSERLTKNETRIQITDTGIGIAKKDLPRIFDRFYRADQAREKKDSGGFGLGLSIAKEIMKRHNGTITVESKMGKGTTVTVSFPAVRKL